MANQPTERTISCQGSSKLFILGQGGIKLRKLSLKDLEMKARDYEVFLRRFAIGH